MKNIYKALADFQQEVPIIHKGTEGYGYSYADLPAIFEVINPLLKKHGLGFTQLVNQDSIKTILFHIESAETLESTTSLSDGVKLAKMNEFQVLGSQITYLRRYAISSMLGLVTDKDTDAAGTQEKKQTTQAKTPTIEDAINEMNNCDTMGRLQNCWTKHKKYQGVQSFINAKNEMKTKLS